MAVKAVYKKYFQKSKVFLYPLLLIKKGAKYIPSETYLSLNDVIKPEDKKLVCNYPVSKTDDYKLFEKNVLLKHTRIYDYIKIDESNAIIIFDFSDLEDDWDMFIKGKYSKISTKSKNLILNFFDKNSGNYKYIEGYLFPNAHFSNYAELLDVDFELLEKVGELCDKPDLEKETLTILINNLTELKVLK
jgi:hypothetical protein